ncbi:MAG: hypothetical protein AAFN48_13425 [Pseudomonadota bacterium]
MAITPLAKDRGYMGDPRRGASLGRSNTSGDPDECWKFYLVRVRLDNGGYDSGGVYWGHGEPLWRYEAADLVYAPGNLGLPSGFVRAVNRDAARRCIREDYPKSRFFR